MIVTDGPFFSGCLMVFGLCFFLLFGAGITLGNWLRLDNPMWGVLIVFSVLWWFIRYRRKQYNRRFGFDD